VRSPDPTDRRRVVVELTAVGLELVVQVNDALHEWEHRLDLPGERGAILASVEALTDAIRATRG
jgi:DNA-binding MarR family transcriptional regulator